MSTIKVTNLRHGSATSDNITLDSSNNAVIAGTLGCTGNLTVTSGNVVLSSGNGIDFSATSGTGTSELLDDYEKGTWTPTFTCGTSGTITNTTTSNYTKIGDIVHISGAVAIDSVSAPAGSVTIGALPFTAIGQAQAASVSSYFNGSGTPNGAKYYGLVYIVNASTTTITVRKDEPTYDSTVADWVAAGTTFFFSMTYKTSA